jgi:CRISPR-associated endoribonuclease Cas6
MQQASIQIHEMILVPDAYETAYAPTLGWETRYVSMSPMILFDPTENFDAPRDLLNPYAAEFSDLLFDTLLDRMEKFPLRQFDFEQYGKFQIVPDARYIEKLRVQKKKLGRALEVKDTKVKAYLFPFTLYAHPDVQNFIYDAGIGAMGADGFGCLDLVLSGKKI